MNKPKGKKKPRKNKVWRQTVEFALFVALFAATFVGIGFLGGSTQGISRGFESGAAAVAQLCPRKNDSIQITIPDYYREAPSKTLPETKAL